MMCSEKFYMKTKRLILRPYVIGDSNDILKVISKKEIYDTTLQIPHPYPRENIAYWIHLTQKNISYGTGYELGIFDKHSMAYIGNIGIAGISKQNNNAEITYFIDPNKWEQGYATEAVERMLTFGFYDLKLERIVGRCMKSNGSSRRVMEKNGFLFEGLARHEVIKEGRYIDIDRLAILAGDYHRLQK